MKIQQIRNATIILESGAYRILVDPMLANKGALPSLRVFSGRQRNPTVELPESASQALETVTHCLITHCQKGHFDHLDRAGTRWLRERQVPVICTPNDAPYLAKRGLNVQSLPEGHEQPTPFLGGTIRTIRCLHGKGLVGRLMEHGVGYLIELPGEPSLYLAGDTILTSTVRDFVLQHQPQVSVVPAGGARFDVGDDIIMGLDDVLEFMRFSEGTVVANHLEAINHCPVTREELADAAAEIGVMHRLLIPADGEVLAVATGKPLPASAGLAAL
ncbi:MBL fold metallo-hydrolase [Pseudomonas sp. BN414]|uniref:MBL fold metallo-hydrolase n=1 Tax=Pseudomonas sp. BN414 TaxID=2567888 RepID=UPI0032B0067A|nr:MBL fold metallo-hydrolase [Pseudomonas sp. BN414]